MIYYQLLLMNYYCQTKWRPLEAIEMFHIVESLVKAEDAVNVPLLRPLPLPFLLAFIIHL